LKDRNTVLALFFLELLTSGPHTPDELHQLVFDWRVLLSVALVTVIVWLAVRWIRLGVHGSGEETTIDPK